MKRYQKVLLVTSACLIVGGGVMGVAGLALGGSPSFIITEKGIQTPEDVAEGKFIEKKLPLKGVGSMEIQWVEGDVEFVEGDNFHVEYGYDEKHVQVKEEKKNGTWYLTSKYIQQFNMTGIHFFWNTNGWEQQDSYLKIYMPRGTKLSDMHVSSGNGKVKIDLTKLTADCVKIDTESGSIEMKGMDCGETKLTQEYGSLKLEDCDFTGLTIEKEGGECSLKNISAGQASVRMEYEEGMSVQGCAIDKLNVTSEGGICSLSDVTAKEVSLDTGYGSLVLEQVVSEQITVNSESGDIRMDTLTGKSLSVGNDYGDVALNNVTMETGIHAEAESGIVQMNRVDAGSLEITSEEGNVQGGQVKIGTGNLEVLYGDCEMDELTVKDLKIESETGEIALALTEEEKHYSMLLKTEFGEVTINGENRGSDIIMERDQAENRLELMSENGNITIKTR